ncbi:ditrans,polycis-polyprenyl diphosphate synthase [Nematocida displodere]|uniref:Ditrans,polycis-polyprenyl diphosphate synthase n=1 Tax=Nematocida displodere TaxID=1805483 RepID=A0A177EAE6_9MICR|nr:ditrans,polycis-polyprenyl diphosphate synthase [Nematocida displodere]
MSYYWACKMDMYLKSRVMDTIDFLLESKELNALVERASMLFPVPEIVLAACGAPIKYLSKYLAGSGFSIGLVMDGHRRFARENGLTTKTGHVYGYTNMDRMARYLVSINCTQVVFFTFGKKNYQRSPKEINDIMSILEQAIASADDGQSLEGKKNREILEMTRVVGDITSMPKTMAEHAKRANETDQSNKKVSVLFSYSSLDEYVQNGTDGLTTPIDIIVRSGGEKRLSDFLLCNASTHATTHFLAVKWPLMSRLHILLILLRYRIEQSLCPDCPEEESKAHASKASAQ